MIVRKLNEVYAVIEDVNPGIAHELSKYFSFPIPGAKFMPAYKKGWDGTIRLYNIKTGKLYLGLVPYLEQFAQEKNYYIKIDPDIEYKTDYSLTEAKDFIKTLNLPLEPRDYQIEGFVHAIRENRGLILSPTSSGKTVLNYLISEYHRQAGCKVLIIVPTTNLILQGVKDFIDYSKDALRDDIGIIMQGYTKTLDKQVTFTTWQSVYQQPEKWFKDIGCVIVDECHLAKAASIKSIMEKLVDCKYRYGVTGTLDGTQTNRFVLEGLFGKVRELVTTNQLMKDKNVADLTIKAIVLKHSQEECKSLRGSGYREEIDYIVGSQKRNDFIIKLSLSLDGNTLVLFQFVDKHGKQLYDKLKHAYKKDNVYFVHGKVDAEDRDEIRNIVNNHKNAIIIASYGTFSTGTNIPNLHNAIFASPSKSKIRVLQSVGRILRLSENKTTSTLFDICDDLRYNEKSKMNYTMRHFNERVKFYNEQKFFYKLYKVNLN